MAAPPEKSLNFVEEISTAVRSIQELRVSVGLVFEQLSDGMKPTEDGDGKHKKFIAEFHQRLLTVVKHYTYVLILSLASVSPFKANHQNVPFTFFRIR
jgi:hypothetical protein